MNWAKEKYNKWLPWIEDLFLKLFTRDNKASYATKDNLNKTKVTGNEHVDKIQGDVNSGVAGQLGQGGIAQPLGDAISKEGINRAERKGKGNTGQYFPGPQDILGGK